MRILLTGVTGFLGSAAAEALLNEGHSVVGFTRSLSRVPMLRRLGIEPAVGNMLCPETYASLVPGVDAVIHAAQTKINGRWTSARLAEMHHSDAVMTRALARACIVGKKPLIYTSGALTHAGYNGQWIDETSAAKPCLAARGHAAMEAELLTLHRNFNLDVRIVSPGFVYGLGGMLHLFLARLLAGQFAHIGDPGNFWSLVHVDDVASAYVRVLHRGQAGQSYFLSDGQPRTRRDVIAAVCQTWRLPQPRTMPGWLMGLARGYPLVEAITASFRLRSDKANSDLGWRPRFTSFEAGLPHLARDWQCRIAELVAA